MSKSISCLLNETDTENMINVVANAIFTPFFKSSKRMKPFGIKISFDESNVAKDVDIVLSFVGEIYNYNELYNLLFNGNEEDCNITHSNERLIIDLYKRYGFDYMIQLLDGKFALVLFDYNYLHDISKVYVARDAFGIIPMYMFKRSQSFSPDEHYGFFTEKNNCIFVDDFVEITPGTYHLYELPSKVSAYWTSGLSLKDNVNTSNITTYYKLPSTTICGITDKNYWNKYLTESVYESITKHLWSTFVNDTEIVYLMTGVLECDSIILRCLRKYLKEHYSDSLIRPNIHTYYLRETLSPIIDENIQQSLKIIKTYHSEIYTSSVGDVSSIWSEIKRKHTDAIFLYASGFKEMIGDTYSGNGDILEYDKFCREQIENLKNNNFLYGEQYIFLDKKIVEIFFNVPIELRIKHREQLFDYVKFL